MRPIDGVCHGPRSTTAQHRREYFLSNPIQQSRGRRKKLNMKGKMIWGRREEKWRYDEEGSLSRRRPIIWENKSAAQGCHWRRKESTGWGFTVASWTLYCRHGDEIRRSNERRTTLHNYQNAQHFETNIKDVPKMTKINWIWHIVVLGKEMWDQIHLWNTNI